MAQPGLQIDELTTAERLDLLEKLWTSLSKDSIPLTEAQTRELDRRLDALDADSRPGEPLGIPWAEVLEQLRARR